jgi:prepilin-type N-terminal cleavage/methylation domain-containing protein
MKIFSKKNGFSLIEVLISMGLVAILSLVVFSLNTFMTKGRVTSETTAAAESFRREVINLLNNPTAWRQTLNNNATFACVTGSTDCAAAGATSNGPPAKDYSISTLSNTSGACAGAACQGGFNVYTAASPTAAVFYPFASNPKRGFSSSGAQCDVDFQNGQAATGAPGWIGVASGKVSIGVSNSSKCPFRLVLWWVPICNSTGACTSPAIRVRGYTLYTPSPSDTTGISAFNPANYGIDLILPPRFR